MRIITGTAKGCRLKSPKGEHTRPTADRVKESLFSILGQRVLERNVLDLFAGTGSLGLEALSRGAAHGVFVDRATVPVLRENLCRTKLADRAEIRKGDVFSVLAGLTEAHRAFGLVFCDPPYHLGLWERALRCVDACGLLAKDGILVVEHGADENEIPSLEHLFRVRNERYGHTTQLSFFQHHDSDSAGGEVR